jgi:SAM-dependent methyltransferase
MSYLEKIFACPRCKTPIKPIDFYGKCPKCKIEYKKKEGIWHFLYIPTKESKDSLLEYNTMHTKEFGGPNDGSYEILASMARGNKTLDIACGEGIIETLAPQTTGVEFSLNALKKAKKNGAKYLVLADAHALPFVDNAFDIAISSGNLEHFSDPQKAINEMARVSKIQVLVVHMYPPLPFSPFLYKLFTLFLKIKHQPIEKPISINQIMKMIKKANLNIIYKGVWTLPVNYGRAIAFLPEFKNIPSCSFVISIKK